MRLLSMILGMCIRKSLEKLFDWRLFGRKMWDMGGYGEKHTPCVIAAIFKNSPGDILEECVLKDWMHG